MPRILQKLLASLSMAATAGAATAIEPPQAADGRILYVRQTVGDDANDGLTPQTAWRTLSKLGPALQAGDTAFVGPGLYREMLAVGGSGTADRPITLIADTAGARTTDPPGVVMITGADAADETMFTAEPAPGVYKATALDRWIMNVVEMDGPQYRYVRAFDTTPHVKEGLPQREVVNKIPASLFHDREAQSLYIHTSDGQPPATHEIELIRRNYGIVTHGKQYVTVIGFTFRHMGTAGLNFADGSHHCAAIGNKSYGAWQGLRVFGSDDVLIANNESFRNSNSGIYISFASARGHAVGNILYGNAKGIRWSSNSVGGLAAGNMIFANRETGIAIEHSDDIRIVGNTLVDNHVSQLMVRKSRFFSEANCIQCAVEDGCIADLSPFEQYRSLAEYQRITRQDLTSPSACPALPGQVDVHALHAESLSYASRVRNLLRQRDTHSPELKQND